MPVRVELPDGSIGEFPDGMPDAEIERVLQRQFGGPQPRADFSDVSATVEHAPRRSEPQASPQPKGNAVTYVLGEIGGRQVLQGAAGLGGALGGDALNYYVLDPLDRALGLDDNPNLRLGTGGRTYRDVASDLADSLGMAKPQTATDRVISDIGEGLTGTALTLGVGGAMNSGKSAVNAVGSTIREKLGKFLTAQPGLQAVSTATGTGAASGTREAGGGLGAQLAAGLVGALAPGGARAGVAASVRGAARGPSGAGMQRQIDDFNAIGTMPSVGQAMGGRVTQAMENLLGGGPTSAGTMGRFVERQADEIGAGLRQRADNLSHNASAERAGRAVERGAQTFAGNVKATKKALYWRVDKLIPEDAKVPLRNTQAALAQLSTPDQAAIATTGGLINPKIAQIAQNVSDDLAANGGDLPYSAVKALRSRIGEELENYSLAPDRPTTEYKQLYAALSQDMEATARAQGPQAYNAFRRANDYTRAAADRLDAINRIVDRNGGPEKIYGAVMAGTKDGGTTLRAVMQSLGPEGQKAIAAAVIKRMGLATPGVQDAAGDVFSAATFLTNWNRVSPEARKALFNRFGPEFASDMDRIARVAENIKSGAKLYANPSGTANRAAAITYSASLLGALVTGQADVAGGLAASGAMANVAARLLTNPRAVRWLARSTEAPKGALPSALHSLRNIGRNHEDPETEELAADLAQVFPEQTPARSAR